MQPSQEQNNKKVYIGNLPFSMTQDDIANLVAEFGETTSVTLITDKMSGRSKGFGFVEFAEEASANAAIEALNNREIDGRALVVNIARPQAPRENGGFRPRRPFGNGGGRDNNRGGYNRN